MVKKTNESLPVSRNNPCPFLRALVADGRLADDAEPVSKVASVIVAAAKKGDGHPALPSAPIYAIALTANGFGPLSVLKTKTQGLKLNQLRNGPLDKKGVGSGILDANGEVSNKELVRLSTFAKEQVTNDGSKELGLTLADLRAYMDANFERAKGRRRLVDRALMNGEWPVLLKVMGKAGQSGRYLSVKDVETLFTDCSLPPRMV
jgi:hypothetical protein